MKNTIIIHKYLNHTFYITRRHDCDTKCLTFCISIVTTVGYLEEFTHNANRIFLIGMGFLFGGN